MCSVVYSKRDLEVACVTRNAALFFATIRFFGEEGEHLAFLYSIRSRWDYVTDVLCNTPLCDYEFNVFEEAVKAHNSFALNLLLSRVDLTNCRAVTRIIEAIRVAECMCQHEFASKLFERLTDYLSEEMLALSFGYEISKSLRKYLDDREHIYNSRHLMEPAYIQPIFVPICSQ
jgi:hypothetical protein